MLRFHQSFKRKDSCRTYFASGSSTARRLSWFHGLVVAFGARPWLSLGCWHLLVSAIAFCLYSSRDWIATFDQFRLQKGRVGSSSFPTPVLTPWNAIRVLTWRQDLCCKIPWHFQSALSQINIDLWHSKVCQTGMMEVSRGSSFS